MAKIEIEIKTLRIAIFVTQPRLAGKPFLRTVAAFWDLDLEPVPVKILAHASGGTSRREELIDSGQAEQSMNASDGAT